MAEASRPSTKNVSVKLPRMNAMTSCIEAPRQCRCVRLGGDDPHGIIGFVHLGKREPRGGPLGDPPRCRGQHRALRCCPQLDDGGALAARRTSETPPFLLRSFGAFRAHSCAGMLLWPRRYDRLGLPI